jgi:hypothetical protein
VHESQEIGAIDNLRVMKCDQTAMYFFGTFLGASLKQFRCEENRYRMIEASTHQWMEYPGHALKGHAMALEFQIWKMWQCE